MTTVVSTTGEAGVNGRTVTVGGETDGDVPDVDAPGAAIVVIGEPDGNVAPLDESGNETAPGVDVTGSEASIAESAANETVDVTWESDCSADESEPLVRLHTTMAIPSMNTTMETGVRSFRDIAGKYQVLRYLDTTKAPFPIRKAGDLRSGHRIHRFMVEIPSEASRLGEPYRRGFPLRDQCHLMRVGGVIISQN
ncbi:MAG: hypothetical protein ACKOI2_12045 [Actinomycetota bacterium]